MWGGTASAHLVGALVVGAFVGALHATRAHGARESETSLGLMSAAFCHNYIGARGRGVGGVSASAHLVGALVGALVAMHLWPLCAPEQPATHW